jgi:hypothetical protein
VSLNHSDLPEKAVRLRFQLFDSHLRRFIQPEVFHTTFASAERAREQWELLFPTMKGIALVIATYRD